jgi:hypothetical protein
MTENKHPLSKLEEKLLASGDAFAGLHRDMCTSDQKNTSLPEGFQEHVTTAAYATMQAMKHYMLGDSNIFNSKNIHDDIIGTAELAIQHLVYDPGMDQHSDAYHCISTVCFGLHKHLTDKDIGEVVIEESHPKVIDDKLEAAAEAFSHEKAQQYHLLTAAYALAQAKGIREQVPEGADDSELSDEMVTSIVMFAAQGTLCRTS